MKLIVLTKEFYAEYGQFKEILTIVLSTIMKNLPKAEKIFR